MSVKFEFIEGEPPRTPRSGRPPVYTEFIEALRENPGTWARIDRVWKSSPSVVRAANKGTGAFAEDGPFEGRSKKVEGGYTAYVRYVGE